jgi:hydroxymethylbilane synthase
MRESRTVRLATRGSDLALRQAAVVEDRLSDRRTTVELVVVETRGDQLREELIHRLGKTGAFVRALDERVLEDDCDAAVHSMKDVPTEFPEALVVAGVPKRAPPHDVLVTPDGGSLADLPDRAVVGTSSLRRTAQLLSERPDLEIAPLRGNVDTRVEKLLAPSRQREHERRMDAEETEEAEAGDGNAAYDRTVEEWFDDLTEIERRALGREWETEYDAIVLAEAGLERIGLLPHVRYERLPLSRFVPAPGQGALAVTALDGEFAEAVHDQVDHPRTRAETTVERTVLETLGGGCVAPVGIHATLRGEYVHAAVRVLSRDGTEEVRATRDLPVGDHAETARAFAEDLAARGASDIIETARVREDEEREAKR